MDAPFRIALSVNGAVALGSYEAGVLTQIYADVFEINRRSGGEQVRIDAIAGASAGAVTGLLVTQALAVGEDPSSLSDRMQRVWVQSDHALNVLSLLGDGNSAANSAFSPEVIQAIAKAEILPPEQIVQRATEGRTPPVALWIALTNLDGIPYKIELEGGEFVVGSLYTDYNPYLIRDGEPYRAPAIETLKEGAVNLPPERKVAWSQLADSAVASGAFPFAFRSQKLTRDLNDYPDYCALVQGMDGAPTFVDANITDGGVLNNNPIGRAIDAAAFANRLDPGVKHRTFLIVEPDPCTVDQAIEALKNAENAKEPNGLPAGDLAGAIVKAYFNSGVYRDLDTAQKTNRRIKAFDAALEELALEQGQKQALRAAAFDHMDLVHIERVPAGPRREVNLQGAFAGHFGGFFAQKYREFDYALGCQEARKWTESWAQRHGFSAFEQGVLVELPAPPAETGFAGVPPTGQEKVAEVASYRGHVLVERILHVDRANLLLKPVIRVAFDRLQGWAKQRILERMRGDKPAR